MAAVCWRPTPSGTPEFLLVRTTAGDRWTFPKGGLEPEDATPGDGARREAREEAGVDSAPTPIPLSLYRHIAHLADGSRRSHRVEAWLVEVTVTDGPAEPGRRPTWFSPGAAAVALAENQSDPEAATELHAVLAAAVEAIGRQTAAAISASTIAD